MFRELFLNEDVNTTSSKVQKFFKLVTKKLKAEDFSISELDTSKKTWTVTFTNVKVLDSDLTLLFKNTESGKFGSPVLIGYKKDTEDFYPANRDITSIKSVANNLRMLINIRGPSYIISKLLSLKLDEINKPEVFSGDLEELNDLYLVQQDGVNIRSIRNPSIEVQLAAVSQDGTNIQFIKNPSKEVQLAAVMQNGYSIQYIRKPTEEIQLAAVRKNGYCILYIRNPSPEVQLAAAKQDGTSIQFTKNPSLEVQLAAVKQCGKCIQYIKNPSLEVQLAAVKQNIRALEFTTPEFKRKYPEYLL